MTFTYMYRCHYHHMNIINTNNNWKVRMLISQFSALRPVISLMISSGLVRNKNHLGVEISSSRKTCSSANGFAFHASSLNILVVASRSSKSSKKTYSWLWKEINIRKRHNDEDMSRTKCVCYETVSKTDILDRSGVLARGEKLWKTNWEDMGGRRRRANSNICGKHNLTIQIFEKT